MNRKTNKEGSGKTEFTCPIDFREVSEIHESYDQTGRSAQLLLSGDRPKFSTLKKRKSELQSIQNSIACPPNSEKSE